MKGTALAVPFVVSVKYVYMLMKKIILIATLYIFLVACNYVQQSEKEKLLLGKWMGAGFSREGVYLSRDNEQASMKVFFDMALRKDPTRKFTSEDTVRFKATLDKMYPNLESSYVVFENNGKFTSYLNFFGNNDQTVKSKWKWVGEDRIQIEREDGYLQILELTASTLKYTSVIPNDKRSSVTIWYKK